jgi:Arm DNA-binding domain
MSLTNTAIVNAKATTKPVKLTDAAGLYLEVRPSGAKLWRYRYRIAGKENLFAAGEFFEGRRGETAEQAIERQNGGLLTLAEARVRREEWRGQVKQGIHPSHHRQQTRSKQATNNANTFEAVALEWIEKKKASWTPYYLGQVKGFMTADAFPYIGNLPIRAVTAAHLLEVMHRVEGRGAATVALLLRQWSSAIFRYAVATLRADADPAVALKGAVQRPPVEHATPLTRDDLIKFVKSVDDYGGYRTTSLLCG